MNTETTLDEQLDARLRRILKTDDRYMTRMDRRWDDAQAQIGNLCRDGKTVFYVMPQGGKYHEGDWHHLIDFLIRNRYA